MRVLGLDPGLATLGYGLIEGDDDRLAALAYGVMVTPAASPPGERLKGLHQGVARLMSLYQPSEVAIERLVPHRLSTALAVGQAMGVALLAAAEAGLPVREYTPLQVKLSVAGYGRGSKGQVQEMVRLQLGLPELPQPDDAADALAVALCHLRHAHLSSLVARAREG